MNTSEFSRTCLHDSLSIDNVLNRMARQAAWLLRGRGPVAVVGMLRRGAPLADRLTRRMVQSYGLPPPLRLDLAVKRYGDDLALLFPDTQLTEDPRHDALNLSGYTLLVVDDVLYTGHSALKVTDWLTRKRPAAIHLAVLVDRCAATLPLHADVVGLRLQIAATDIIECHVPPYESDFTVQLLQPAAQIEPKEDPIYVHGP